MAASIAGAREMVVPVTFAILTTIAAFSPMFFIPGFMGKLFRILPAVIVSVLIFSLIESFFILPAHLAHSNEGKRGIRARLVAWVTGKIDPFRARVSGALAQFTRDKYAPFLQRVLDRRYLATSIAIGMLLFTFGLIGGRLVPFSFMPDMEGIIVTASARLPIFCLLTGNFLLEKSVAVCLFPLATHPEALAAWHAVGRRLMSAGVAACGHAPPSQTPAQVLQCQARPIVVTVLVLVDMVMSNE